jgi:hypothetical protein
MNVWKDRQTDPVTRKWVAEMSAQELRHALLVPEKTDLPNWRAFEEGGASPFVAMCDVNGLKTLNDQFGYTAGDVLIKRLAEMLISVGLDAYHDKGDEFLCKGKSFQELNQKLAGPTHFKPATICGGCSRWSYYDNRGRRFLLRDRDEPPRSRTVAQEPEGTAKSAEMKGYENPLNGGAMGVRYCVESNGGPRAMCEHKHLTYGQAMAHPPLSSCGAEAVPRLGSWPQERSALQHLMSGSKRDPAARVWVGKTGGEFANAR